MKPKDAQKIRDLLEWALDTIPGYVDGRNDKLMDGLAWAIEKMEKELPKEQT